MNLNIFVIVGQEMNYLAKLLLEIDISLVTHRSTKTEGFKIDIMPPLTSETLELIRGSLKLDL